MEHEVELLANTVLRLLDIEGYTYEDHKLTPWGKALSEAMRFLGPSPPPGIEEGVFLIVEMLRLDVMNPTEVSPGLTGSANITGKSSDSVRLSILFLSQSLVFLFRNDTYQEGRRGLSR